MTKSLLLANARKMTTSRRQQPGYTLIELLVAITIFSAVMIISIATFARSATSAVRSNALRERTEATRALVDQISNDTHYVDTSTLVTQEGETPANYKGFGNLDINPLNSQKFVLVLRYPGEAATDLVRKVYEVKEQDGQMTLLVRENRGCRIDVGKLTCVSPPLGQEEPQNLLSNKFSLDSLDTSKPIFRVFDELAAAAAGTSAYLQLALTIKPIDYAQVPCNDDQMPAGVCYSVQTTLVVKGQS